MRPEIALSNAFPLIPDGIPKMPYKQIKRTATIRAILFLRFFFIFPILYSKRSRRGALGFRSVVLRDRSNRVLGNFELEVVGSDTNHERIVLDRDDDAANPSGGCDPISRLDTGQHLLPLLLPFILRADHDQVEQREKQQGKQHSQAAAGCGRSRPKCKACRFVHGWLASLTRPPGCRSPVWGAGSPGHRCRRLTRNLSPGKVLEASVFSGPHTSCSTQHPPGIEAQEKVVHTTFVQPGLPKRMPRKIRNARWGRCQGDKALRVTGSTRSDLYRPLTNCLPALYGEGLLLGIRGPPAGPGLTESRHKGGRKGRSPQ